jgi:hypothetical protein
VKLNSKSLIMVVRRLLLAIWIICALAVVADLLSTPAPRSIPFHPGAARSIGELVGGWLAGSFLLALSHLFDPLVLCLRIFVVAGLFCWLVIRARDEIRSLKHLRDPATRR